MYKEQLNNKVQSLVDEYCREAEHQDGPEYWDQFNTLNEALQDFILYAQGSLDLGDPQ